MQRFFLLESDFYTEIAVNITTCKHFALGFGMGIEIWYQCGISTDTSDTDAAQISVLHLGSTHYRTEPEMLNLLCSVSCPILPPGIQTQTLQAKA